MLAVFHLFPVPEMGAPQDFIFKHSCVNDSHNEPPIGRHMLDRERFMVGISLPCISLTDSSARGFTFLPLGGPNQIIAGFAKFCGFGALHTPGLLASVSRLGSVATTRVSSRLASPLCVLTLCAQHQSFTHPTPLHQPTSQSQPSMLTAPA